MKNKILWGLTLLPMIVTAVVLRFMPDEVPMHYDISGNIDRWGSKYENFIFPCMIVVFTLFWICFMKYFRKKQANAKDEKTANEAMNNEKLIYYAAVGMAVMFGVMQYFILYSAFVAAKDNMTSSAIDISIVTNVVMGVFMIFLGNVLPKAKPNSVAGVRTVWAMHNDKTWAESNRFGGAALMVCGVMVVIESLIFGGIASTLIMLAMIIVFGVIVTVHSYKVYKKYK